MQPSCRYAATLAIILALLPSTLRAAGTDESSLFEKMISCAAVADSLERLRCFDDLAKAETAMRQAPDAAAPEQKPAAEDGPAAVSQQLEILKDWQVQEDKSPIDDTPIVMLSRFSVEPYHNRFGGEELAILAIRCGDNTTGLALSTGTFMSDDTVRVTLRLDDKQAFDQRWFRSTNYRAIWAPQPINLIKDLMAAKKLVARIDVPDDANITVTFDLSGLGGYIGKVQQACHWQ